MAMYVYAPAGDSRLHNLLLKSGVEFIGSHQPGIGSAFAKGKRYIKAKLNCSTRAINMTCKIKHKVRKHDFELYGTEVYYYHKECCAKIVEFVLEYLVLHKDDPVLPQIFAGQSFNDMLNITYAHRISQLKWVCVQNYKEQGENAEGVYNALNNLYQK